MMNSNGRSVMLLSMMLVGTSLASNIPVEILKNAQRRITITQDPYTPSQIPRIKDSNNAESSGDLTQRKIGRKLNSLSQTADESYSVTGSVQPFELPNEQLNNTEVYAQVGGTATLSCYTGHISDEVVTWLKRDDDQLLTIGQDLYATEVRRYSASISQATKAWELFIRDVQLSDAGHYECQLTTHPPVTFFFNLKITQAKAVVMGSREVHIEECSQLALQCYVKDAPSPPVYIFWYHNGTMVNYERDRDLIVHHENFTSSLVIAKVTPSDAGVYSCEPHLAKRASVIVHVVTGESPAAMQHGVNQVEAASSVFAPHYYGPVVYILFPLLVLIMQTKLYSILMARNLSTTNQ